MKLALNLRAFLGCTIPLFAALSARGQTDLERGFRAPPDSAKPQTWWHWMNGNITREGITADLEAMKRAGLGGAQILNVLCNIPHGPVQVLGPEWRQMMRHAFAEGDRLGIEICVHNCPGYTSSGGPCVKPDQAMQMVTTSELYVSGPTNISIALPEPEKRSGFYRDIAVLAFPTILGDAQNMADFKPVISTAVARLMGRRLVDGNPATLVNLPLPEPGKPQFVQLEFSQPFEARSLTVWLPPGLHTHTAELQVSDDGKSFRKVRDLTLQNQGWGASWQTDSFEPAKGRWFRLVITRSRTKASTVGLGEISLGQRLQTDRISVKAGYDRADGLDPEGGCVASAGMAIERKQMVDLTAKLQADGKLNWAVPAGNWTILRLGHTCTGKKNHPAPPEAAGLEVDKLSREALDAFWSGMMEPLIKDAGPLAGRSFNNVLIDSYEVGGQNWTARMREEFRRRRGYDLQPFLPALTGRVVENPELTERFLWDFRRTLADLFAENYFGHMAELCHKHGLKFSAETYGNAVFDELQCGAKADIVMGEFWATGSGMLETLKLAASSAHTRGRALVGAEAFTSSEKADEWRLEPWSLKAVGDLAFCDGVNRYIFHRYAHQPWLDKFPGMTMGPYGLHFERTQTWWEPGAAWLRYIARCQFLLQSGQFVGDLCYFIGEGQPAKLPARATLNPAVPAGYDYDGCDLEMLREMKVKGGCLVLPGGMSYRVLVLPESRFMTPATLAKVRELVKAGATVVGPKPVKSPSLADFPKCDAEVAKVAGEVWGNCDGKTAQEHALGKGKVVWGKPLDQVLAESGVTPDFQEVPDIRYIHRSAGAADIYFVSNQRRAAAKELEASFRVSGKQPELWHPDSGVIEPAAVWFERGGRTVVPLRLDAAGSVFVVFRKPAGQNEHAVGMAKLAGGLPGQAAPIIVIQKAIYEGVEGGGSADVTKKLAELVRAGKLSISAENTLFGDPAPMKNKRLRVEYLSGRKEAAEDGR